MLKPDTTKIIIEVVFDPMNRCAERIARFHSVQSGTSGGWYLYYLGKIGVWTTLLIPWALRPQGLVAIGVAVPSARALEVRLDSAVLSGTSTG